MSTSKRDYQVIAGAIANADAKLNSIEGERASEGMVRELVAYFEVTNPNFDRETFIIASLGRSYFRHEIDEGGE